MSNRREAANLQDVGLVLAQKFGLAVRWPPVVSCKLSRDSLTNKGWSLSRRSRVDRLQSEMVASAASVSRWLGSLHESDVERFSHVVPKLPGFSRLDMAEPPRGQGWGSLGEWSGRWLPVEPGRPVGDESGRQPAHAPGEVLVGHFGQQRRGSLGSEFPTQRGERRRRQL